MVVFQRSVDDVVFQEAEEVVDAATNQALEHEDVALDGECRCIGQVAFVELAHLVKGQVIGCAVDLFGRCVVAELSVVGPPFVEGII